MEYFGTSSLTLANQIANRKKKSAPSLSVWQDEEVNYVICRDSKSLHHHVLNQKAFQGGVY